MLSWKNDPNCLFTRFEDLIGSQGGGTQQQQQLAVSNIAIYLGKAFEGTIAADFENIYTPDARTFRKGSIDSWKQSFDAATLSKINEYCHPLCKAAGYL